jgi:hypothetical protein
VRFRLGLSLGTVLLMLGALMVEVAAGQAPQGRPSGDPAGRWQRVVSEEGRFSVLMPGRPKFTTKTDRGEGWSYRDFRYTLAGDGQFYAVDYSDHQGPLDVDAEVNGFARGAEVAIISRRRTAIDGHPVEVVELGSAEQRFTFRAFTVGTRLYQIVYGARRDRFSSSDAETFMRSFWLNP